jgi:hypothetical protein
MYEGVRPRHDMALYGRVVCLTVALEPEVRRIKGIRFVEHRRFLRAPGRLREPFGLAVRASELERHLTRTTAPAARCGARTSSAKRYTSAGNPLPAGARERGHRVSVLGDHLPVHQRLHLRAGHRISDIGATEGQEAPTIIPNIKRMWLSPRPCSGCSKDPLVRLNTARKSL